MSEIQYLLKISRPRFWIYILGPFLIGAVAAARTSTDPTSTWVLVFGALFLFPANLLIYGINDIFDYETDRLNPKKAGYESLVPPSQRTKLVLYIALFNLPFLISAFFHSRNTLAALAGFLFFSIGYSAPPIRAKTKPFLDSAFNILYVFPAITAYVLIAGVFPPWIIIAAAGFWTMAMHAYSAIPDIESDQKAKIKTIATALGKNGTLAFCLVCYILSAVIAFRYIGVSAAVFAALYAVMIAMSFRLSESDRLFDVYRLFPILNAVVGFFLFWIIAWPKFT